MFQKTNGISCAVVCLLVAITAAPIAAKTHEVTPGMSYEDALLVVKKCVVEATSFNAYRDKDKYKQLRAEDKLDYVGITDSLRLNALRRYIVRNTDFGIQSIWGSRHGHFRPYLVPVSALNGLKKEMTIEEVARKVVAEAGLPFLRYEKVAKLVANCRADAKHEYSTLAISRSFKEDHLTAQHRVDLANCLVGKKHGVETLGVIDGEGDYYSYRGDYILNFVTATLRSEDNTYRNLIEDVYRHASVRFGSSLSAEIIVKAGILVHLGCQEISFPIATLCLPQTSTAASSGKLFSDLTLADIETRSKTSIGTPLPSVLTDFQLSNTVQVQSVPNLSGVTGDHSKTIGDLIKEVKGKLEGKR